MASKIARQTSAPPPPPDSSGYEEERIPFDQVLRKLVNAKPAHKVAAPKPRIRKPAKK